MFSCSSANFYLQSLKLNVVMRELVGHLWDVSTKAYQGLDIMLYDSYTSNSKNSDKIVTAMAT